MAGCAFISVIVIIRHLWNFGELDCDHWRYIVSRIINPRDLRDSETRRRKRNNLKTEWYGRVSLFHKRWPLTRPGRLHPGSVHESTNTILSRCHLCRQPIGRYTRYKPALASRRPWVKFRYRPSVIGCKLFNVITSCRKSWTSSAEAVVCISKPSSNRPHPMASKRRCISRTLSRCTRAGRPAWLPAVIGCGTGCGAWRQRW